MATSKPHSLADHLHGEGHDHEHDGEHDHEHDSFAEEDPLWLQDNVCLLYTSDAADE